ncbi:unnamed protein product [Caretta caretta]
MPCNSISLSTKSQRVPGNSTILPSRSIPWPLLELRATQAGVLETGHVAALIVPRIPDLLLPISPDLLFKGRFSTNELYAPFTWTIRPKLTSGRDCEKENP